MKTLKELADLGAAAAFADNKRYHYMSVSEQAHSWEQDESARQAFAQVVKYEVEKDWKANSEELSRQLKYADKVRAGWMERAHEAESKVEQLQKQNDHLAKGIVAEQHKKPWTLPPPPEGQQWHRDDWTEEMLPEGYRPLLLGEKPLDGDEVLKSPTWFKQHTWELKFVADVGHYHQRTRRPLPTPPDPYAELKAAKAAGKVIQIVTIGGTWIDTPYPTFSYPSHQYRIKPEPVLVPLDMDDIRATDEFKHMESHIVETADHWNCQEVTLSWSGAPSYDVLAAFYLRRQHGSNEWKPCTKEAQQ